MKKLYPFQKAFTRNEPLQKIISKWRKPQARTAQQSHSQKLWIYQLNVIPVTEEDNRIHNYQIPSNKFQTLDGGCISAKSFEGDKLN